MEKLTPEQKKAFNEVLDEAYKVQQNRGNFHLGKEIDFGLHPLVEKIFKLITMEKTVQELFDEFVALHGAAATVAAVKGHVKPFSGTGCTKDSDCGHGYICSGGSCVLDVGH